MIRRRLLASVTIAVLAIGAAVLGSGDTRAAGINADMGDFWFCNPSFEFGVCENDNLSTEVFVGDRVTWTMTAVTIHTVSQCTDNTFSSCDNGFQSGLLLGGIGSTYSTTLPQTGTFFYRCNLHPVRMRGQIVVTDRPIDSDGDTILDEQDPDDDNDGVLDQDDACPKLPGVPSENGCPLPGPPGAVGGIAGLVDRDDAAIAATEPTGNHRGYLVVTGAFVVAALAGGSIWRRRRDSNP